MNIGDVLGLPDEPPVGTELEVTDDHGRFRIRRDRKGWYITTTTSHISWKSAFRAWLSEPGTTATVVKLP